MMSSIQQDVVLQRIKEQNIRWLRKHLFTLLGEDISVKKLIDISSRDSYLQECFTHIAPAQVEQLSRALTESAIHKKVSLLVFAVEDDVDVVSVRNKMKKMNCSTIREISCLSSPFRLFSTEVSQIEHDETAIIYISEHVAEHVDDIKVKLSYIIGHLGKDNIVIFFKNCELYDSIRAFIHDASVICERISVLEL